MNRSPTFSSVVVCSTGGFLIAPEFSIIYQRVAMPMNLTGRDWRRSLIPYGVVNKCPRVRDKWRLASSPRISGGILSGSGSGSEVIVWLEPGEVATSAAIATHAPSERSSLLPGLFLRHESGRPFQLLLTKLGYISEVDYWGGHRMAWGEQQRGLIFNELLLRLCSGDLETQRATCITEVNHGYLSGLYRGNIRESTKFLRMHMVLISVCSWRRRLQSRAVQ